MSVLLPLRLLIQRLLDGVLTLDPDSGASLCSLSGRSATFVIDPPGWRFVLTIVDERFQIGTDDDGDSDVTLTGSPGDFLSMFDSNDALYNGAVRIEGDTGVAQSLRSFFARLDIDWASALEPILGESATHRVDRAIEETRNWHARTFDSLREDVREYVSEEQKLLPTQVEARIFFEAVDSLRADVDRLDARLNLVEKQRQASAMGRQQTEALSSAADRHGDSGTR